MEGGHHGRLVGSASPLGTSSISLVPRLEVVELRSHDIQVIAPRCPAFDVARLHPLTARARSSIPADSLPDRAIMGGSRSERRPSREAFRCAGSRFWR